MYISKLFTKDRPNHHDSALIARFELTPAMRCYHTSQYCITHTSVQTSIVSHFLIHQYKPVLYHTFLIHQYSK